MATGAVGLTFWARVGALASLAAAASCCLRNTSRGSVVIRACSSGEATMRIATWFWPAKKSASPTSAVKSRWRSPWER